MCHQPLAISHDVRTSAPPHLALRTSHSASLDVHSALLMHSRRYRPALFLLFVGSGCAALIYEIVWFQLLQLVIGSSSLSLGILLGTFMGGMCLGSLLFPRMISARRHPLR